eukprot:5976852-Ditylum_brightwellii.AAC.2
MLDSRTDPANNHPETDLEMDQSQYAGGNEQGLEQNDDTNSTTTATPNKNNLQTTPPVIDEPDDEEDDVPDLIKQVTEINDQLSRPDKTTNVGGSGVTGDCRPSVAICAMTTPEWRPVMLKHQVSWSRRGGDRVLQWVQKVEHDLDHAVRQIVHLYNTFLDADDNVRHIRPLQKGSRKRKKTKTKLQMKYGIKVPRNVKEAIQFDEENGNTFWQDRMKSEVGALMEMDYFAFKTEEESKTCCGGHLVDIMDTPVYSSTVKSISVQLLHVISHKASLEQLCGDIGNAFPNAFTNETLFVARAGPEFGKHEGKCITRFNNDVWIRLDKSGKMYEYICTHVDNLMICSKEPDKVVKEIESVYLVKDSSKGQPDYYLGNDYKKDSHGRWCIGSK